MPSQTVKTKNVPRDVNISRGMLPSVISPPPNGTTIYSVGSLPECKMPNFNVSYLYSEIIIRPIPCFSWPDLVLTAKWCWTSILIIVLVIRKAADVQSHSPNPFWKALRRCPLTVQTRCHSSAWRWLAHLRSVSLVMVVDLDSNDCPQLIFPFIFESIKGSMSLMIP